MPLQILKIIHHRISIYTLSIVLTFGVLYCTGLGVYYSYIHEKMEEYADSILTRSDSLIAQVKLIDGLRWSAGIGKPAEAGLHRQRPEPEVGG